ncbi:MAG: heterocyst frequency control protein PatD [Stigonema ocellatum SAG 48.90 = DSM 106950]|nr:heterocyst frequency control protein PatD [Stigonema ocellatum SAG 48.90 = DSM 106950]
MSLNQDKYHEFATLLEQLRSDAQASLIDTSLLRQYTVSLRQFFQQQILPLADVDTDSPDAGRVQSYQTEMSKQLRLLELDVIFFQAARQPSTAQIKLDAISDRLTTLIGYCKKSGELGMGSGEWGMGNGE